jgi:SHS2 domain-containing protein
MEVRALRITDGRLEAEIRGRPVAVWQSPLKAATYHGLRLGREGDRWKAVVLLDV